LISFDTSIAIAYALVTLMKWCAYCARPLMAIRGSPFFPLPLIYPRSLSDADI
jgi:hypothetical protein